MGISAGVAAAALPESARGEEDIDDCHFHAEKLATAMKAQYGGEWTVSIKPEYGFVVIVKD